MEDRHIIWSNENLDLDDWREDLQEQYPDCSEDELYASCARQTPIISPTSV